jgi:hypothetical protein
MPVRTGADVPVTSQHRICKIAAAAFAALTCIRLNRVPAGLCDSRIAGPKHAWSSSALEESPWQEAREERDGPRPRTVSSSRSRPRRAHR